MWEVIRIIVLGIFLLIEGIRDFKSHRISMISVFLFAIMGILLELPEGLAVWKDMTVGAAIGIAVLFLAKITGEKIGLGDGWVLTVTGLYLGFPDNLILFMIALFLCAFVSILLLLIRKANKKTELPFVSFIFMGYLLIIAI